MSRKKADRFAKKHLKKIMDEPGAWDAMNDVLQTKRLQRFLREERVRLGLKQSEVADRMDVSQGRISELETELWPDFFISTWSRWAYALGVELDFSVIPKMTQEEVEKVDG